MTDFTLWLEFEEVSGPWDIANDACNIHVDLPDGRHYGITVWTYQFLQTIVRQDEQTGECLGGAYVQPPDLFVRELTRPCISAAIADLLRAGPLEQALNPSVLSPHGQ